ncbi:hypothetical protein [Lentibacillus saliphilus]|uniref:hypothetical protein n=1 Tax=Lentibacillus saliphilus TaxID=2737028 RepID=UPI001C2FC38E|nr:hypothetical protein [Lentibacillus saliphilus]
MHIKKALSLYLNNILVVVLVSMTIVFPLQLATYTFTSIILALLGLNTGSIIINIIIQLFLLNMMQIPFIYIAAQAYKEEKVNLLKVYSTFVMNLVPVFIMNVYYLLCILAGLPLLILPGIFMLILFCIVPYTKVIEQKDGMAWFKQTYQIGRSGVIDILILIFMLVCFNLLVWSLFSKGLYWIDPNMKLNSILLFRLLINSMIVPFFVFVVTMNYFDWQEDSRSKRDAFLLEAR